MWSVSVLCGLLKEDMSRHLQEMQVSVTSFKCVCEFVWVFAYEEKCVKLRMLLFFLYTFVISIVLV